MLDQAEIDFILRVIVSAGKDPADPAVWEEYKQRYLEMDAITRFQKQKPEGGIQ